MNAPFDPIAWCKAYQAQAAATRLFYRVVEWHPGTRPHFRAYLPTGTVVLLDVATVATAIGQPVPSVEEVNRDFLVKAVAATPKPLVEPVKRNALKSSTRKRR